MNRELTIQLKHPKVSVSFFVPKCSDEDKRTACIHNANILEAKERPGYEPINWLAFPPKKISLLTLLSDMVWCLESKRR